MSPFIFDPQNMTVTEIFERAELYRLRMLSKVPESMMKPFQKKAEQMVKSTEGRGGPITVVVTHRYGETPAP